MSDRVSEVILGLQALRNAEDLSTKGAYWSAFCRLVRELCVAREVWVIQSSPQVSAIAGHANQANGDSAEHNGEIPVWFEAMRDRANAKGFAISPDGDEQQPGARIVVPMSAFESGYLVIRLEAREVARANELMLRARLVADMAPNTPEPGDYGTGDGLLNEYLQLVAQINTHQRFATAAYALVNGLVGQDEAIGLAAVGWREGAYIRVKALSHYDRFERRTEWVKRIEAALEESADQDRPIAYPMAEDQASLITRAHHQLKIQSGAESLLSIPVGEFSGDGELVLLALGYDEPLGEDRIRRLRLLAELVYPILCRLRQQEASWFERLKTKARAMGSWLLGSDRLPLKAGLLTLSLALLFGIFGTLPHRVEGNARLVTDEMRVFAAPFEGRIDDALVNSGEPVAAGDVIARMDVEDLLLQRGELQADLRRQVAEVRRARAVGELVDAEIASARVEQARARLARVEARLAQAEIVSGFDGIVVEGERQSLLGRPVRQGDALYRVAQLDGMYLRVDIPQENIHFVEPGEQGEFVFLSRPGEVLPIVVTRIVPMARVESGQGAFFEVIAEPDVTADAWWRPGMEGVARIDQGRRSVLWVLGHRLMNRLRVWLWW